MDRVDGHDPSSELNDVALSQRLRDVAVPSDLRAKLLAIPETDTPATLSSAPTTNSVTWRHRTGWVVAFAAAALGSLVAWQYFGVEDNVSELVLKTNGEASPLTIEQFGPGSPEANTTTSQSTEALELKQWLDEHQARVEAIQSELAEFELHELEHRRVKRQSQSIVGLSHRETVALAYALSGETMHQWAGATAVVKEQLNQVVRVFPETKGSELASQILSN
ncbi:MAG: hypothetical protein Q8M16_19780 [Pirellulaceae bacterium]|nr:hypothetical protein [Pirellulaceae bacterium]